ncbi:MAG TPA: YqgE/AlgH family protein [Sphingomonadaceae bacterium]
MSEAEYLDGRLLLAMPGMVDPNFERSVIALCVHDAQGAVGIGVGHLRAGIRFHNLLREVGVDPGVAPDRPVHHGGPVEPGRGFVLHSPDWRDDDTIAVPPLGALSGSIAVLRAIAEGRGPKAWLIALGYAGWGPGQLDDEMRYHGWFAATGRPEIVFETAVEQRWPAAWKAEGINPAQLVGRTGTA